MTSNGIGPRRAAGNRHHIAGFLEKEGTMGFLVFVAALVVLDLLALRWGADSRDGRPNWR